MAKIGAQYPCFKPDDATNGVVIGGLIMANLTTNLASGEIYSDDRLSDSVSLFASGSIAMETDDMEDEVASVVYGCAVEDSVITDNIEDTPPMGALAYFTTIRRGGKVFYKGHYYPRAQAALGNDNAQTRGSSITFQTTSTTFTVFADDNGDWRERETFNTISEARAWVNGKCSITP